MVRLVLVALFALVLFAAPVSAQEVIDGYRLNIYPAAAPAGATPLTFFDMLVAAVSCNQPPVIASASVPVNPSLVSWDDPALVGRTCQWTDNGKGPLFAVPFGAFYEAGLQAYNEAGRGPESNRAPFRRLAMPGHVPTGLRLRRQ